jgi:membrane fusion protein (multidrug efflux system)
MSDEPEKSAAPPVSAPPAKRKGVNPKVRTGLVLAAIVLAVLGVIFGIRWLVHGRYIMSTDDAYLRADLVTVAPRVSGYIEELYVSENQTVEAGQPLLRIDTRNYKDALSQQTATQDARLADVQAAESQVRQQQAVVEQQRAQLASATASAQFAQEQADRYKSLHEQGVETKERSQQAESERIQALAAVESAAAGVHVAERQLATITSQVAQARAQLESARAAVSTAQMNLDDTLVRASIAGVVGDDAARVGQFVQPGTRLLSIVPVESIYLVGNFKETQLARMRIGQPATVKVDALGGVEIQGELASFAPGTGSEFALLPPENATGNFIKIVQRVPVRVALHPPRDLAHSLLPGLSATVAIDTTHEGKKSP